MHSLSTAMIISYLARIILLLPEITAADANKLASIAENSKQQQHLPTQKPYVPADVYSPMYDFNRPIKNGKNNGQKYKSQSHHLPTKIKDNEIPQKCVPVNETMRKHLIKVGYSSCKKIDIIYIYLETI